MPEYKVSYDSESRPDRNPLAAFFPDNDHYLGTFQDDDAAVRRARQWAAESYAKNVFLFRKSVMHFNGQARPAWYDVARF